MVISDRHRYVFVQIPQTASTAVGSELCEFYGGREILEKHSSYHDFLRFATDEEKRYRVIACIRNPMDIVVSRYFRVLADQHPRYSKASPGDSHLKRLRDWLIHHERRTYRHVHQPGGSFPSYFRRFYWWVYNSRVCMLPAHAYLIRFERLSEDFDRVLRELGLTKVRDLPVRNPTRSRGRDFSAYYPPDLRPRAVWVFGPFMERWGYQFPPEWGKVSTPRASRLLFRFDTAVRFLYFKHLDTRLRGRMLRRTWSSSAVERSVAQRCGKRA